MLWKVVKKSAATAAKQCTVALMVAPPVHALHTNNTTTKNTTLVNLILTSDACPQSDDGFGSDDEGEMVIIKT
jgi:hypothetical protein